MSTIEKLKEVFSTVMPQTDISNVGPETSIGADLGVDSLHMVLLAIAIEDAFAVKLDFSKPFKTVGDVAAIIEAAQASEGAKNANR